MAPLNIWKKYYNKLLNWVEDDKRYRYVNIKILINLLYFNKKLRYCYVKNSKIHFKFSHTLSNLIILKIMTNKLTK